MKQADPKELGFDPERLARVVNVLVLNRIERGDLRLMMPVCELIP